MGIEGPFSTSIGSIFTGESAGKKSLTASLVIASLISGFEMWGLSGLSPQGTIQISSIFSSASACSGELVSTSFGYFVFEMNMLITSDAAYKAIG